MSLVSLQPLRALTEVGNDTAHALCGQCDVRLWGMITKNEDVAIDQEEMTD